MNARELVSEVLGYKNNLTVFLWVLHCHPRGVFGFGMFFVVCGFFGGGKLFYLFFL